MSKWKVRWSISDFWWDFSNFDAETFDNFDSAKAKFYEKMEEVYEDFFLGPDDMVREELDKDGEDGEAIVQYINDFFCGNLTQEDSLVVDYSGREFNLCIKKEGIYMEESANCRLNFYLTILTNFLTIDDEDEKYSLYVGIPYDASEDVYSCEAKVVLEKI